MEKILIVNPFGIGDVLFTTPVIRALKEKYPDSFIGYWCNERTGDLLKGNPYINRVFDLSRGDIKRVYKGLKRVSVLFNLIRQIRRERFDVAFDFSLDSRYGLWSKLAGIKRRIGFDYKSRGRFLTDKIGLTGYSGRHVVEYYFDLLKFIGIDASSPALVQPRPVISHRLAQAGAEKGGGRMSYSLDVSKENSAKAKNMLAGYGVKSSDLAVGIAPGGGASWGRDALYKQWPAKKFGQLAERLTKDLNAGVILLGSVDEKPLAEIVMGKMRQFRGKIGTVPEGDCPYFPIDLIGKLNLGELAAVIKELKLLICNDGGLLHMAAALGTSTVSIFGPVDEKVYGPYPAAEKHIVVKKDLSCRPCYKNFRFKGCFNNKRCLEDITADEVFEGVKRLLYMY